MTYLVWAVFQRPELRQSLEGEISNLGPDLTDADTEKLPLLNAVINETQRLYGAAPGTLPRVTPEGGATLHGYTIAGGTVVGTQAYTLHRDARTFAKPDLYVSNDAAASPTKLTSTDSSQSAGSRSKRRLQKRPSRLLERALVPVSECTLLGLSCAWPQQFSSGRVRGE